MATIKSVFCKTRNDARHAKVDYDGKIIDNGADAPAGKRWEVQYTVEAPKSEAVAQLAAMLQAEVMDVALEPVEPRDIMGLPLVDSRQVHNHSYTLKDRKGNNVNVLVRRSRTAALLAASLARS
jgi:hypothetical protein